METASLQLPKDLIEAAIKQQVSTAMAAAFVDKDRIIRECVVAVLSQKVDSNFKPSSYSYDKPFIEVALQTALRAAIVEALKEQVDLHKEAIKAQLADQLSRKNSPIVKQMVTSMVNGITEAVTANYKLTVTVE